MMRNAIRAMWAAALLTTPWATTAGAADPPPPSAGATPPPPPVISTHQIDRYDAIAQIQQKLQQDPRSLADWVILGEITHEVALDLPADQAARYNQMSLDAYQKALALAPDNPGLKAAVQFARDQQANQEQLERSRDQATQTYLEARRRDLTATNYTPTVRVTSPPVPSSAIPAEAPAAPTAVPPANPPGVATAVPTSPTYSYQPLYSPTTTTPYTFRQYSSAYYPPNYYAPGTAPMSAQRYLQRSLINAAGQQLLRGVAPR